jgi:hypothetical protein
MSTNWIADYETEQIEKKKKKEFKYLIHESGKPIEETFLENDPEIKEVTLDGAKFKARQFRVLANESGTLRETIESVTSSRLMDLITAEAKRAPLKGRTFVITSYNDGLKKTWTMTEVKEHDRA